MIIDARSLASGTLIDTDVAIVGGGMAGLAVALELGPLRACLIESGGLENDAEVQSLATVLPGKSALAPSFSGQRQLGGMAHLWNVSIDHGRPAARFIPLDEVDFEERDYIPFSGWPWPRGFLDAYYRRARQWCGLPGVVEPAGPDGGELAGNGFQTTLEDFVPAQVVTKGLIKAVRDATTVTTLHHATVIGIDTNDAGTSVARVQVMTGPARRITIAAKTFVLAAGGVENARLLLVSTGTHKSGLGNQHDVVGRYFMDHHRLNGGELVPIDPMLFNRAGTYDLRPVSGRYRMGKLTPTRELMNRARLLNSSTMLRPKVRAELDGATDSLKRLASRARPHELRADLRAIAAGLPYLVGTGARLWAHQRLFPPDFARGGWSLLPRNDRRFTSFELIHQCEQAPQPDNRVRLTDERDGWGVQLPVVDTKWSPVDLSSISRLSRLLEAHFSSAGIGRLIPPKGDAPDLHNAGGIHHHLGATRMHADPRLGVVDTECRVHGVANLYVAGGSVFPTGGYANPNLTIIALTLRLGDHLRSSLPAPAAATEPSSGITDFAP